MRIKYSYKGYPVTVIKNKPKMQLSKDVPVTKEFRKEMNKWMLEFFGTTESVRGYTFNGESFEMSEAMLNSLKGSEHLRAWRV